MKLGYIYSGKVLGNLAPGGTDPYTNEPSEHVLACDLGEDNTYTSRICPLTVKVDETSNWYPTGDPSQVNADVYAAWFVVQLGLEPSPVTGSTILRLESNTKGITLQSFFACIVSGVPQGDFNYFCILHPATNVAAWSASGTVTGEDGWIRIRVATEDKYIQLFNSPP